MDNSIQIIIEEEKSENNPESTSSNPNDQTNLSPEKASNGYVTYHFNNDGELVRRLSKTKAEESPDENKEYMKNKKEKR